MSKKKTLEEVHAALMAEADRVLEIMGKDKLNPDRLDYADLYQMSKLLADVSLAQGDMKDYRRHLADARKYKPLPKEYILTVFEQENPDPKIFAFRFSWQTNKGEPVDFLNSQIYLWKIKHLDGRMVSKAAELPVYYRIEPVRTAVPGVYAVTMTGKNKPKVNGYYRVVIEGINERVIDYLGIEICVRR